MLQNLLSFVVAVAAIVAVHVAVGLPLPMLKDLVAELLQLQLLFVAAWKCLQLMMKWLVKLLMKLQLPPQQGQWCLPVTSELWSGQEIGEQVCW